MAAGYGEREAASGIFLTGFFFWGIFKYTVRTLFYLRNTVRIYWAPSPTATSVSTTKNCGRVFRFASTWICDVKIVELDLLRVSVGDVDFHDIVSADWDSNFEIFDFRFSISNFDFDFDLR